MTNETIDQTTTPDQTLNQTDFVPQRFINNLQVAFIKVDSAVALFDPIKNQSLIRMIGITGKLLRKSRN